MVPVAPQALFARIDRESEALRIFRCQSKAYGTVMTHDDRVQRSVVDHVLWCQDERERLRAELLKYESGALSIGVPRSGELRTTGTATHILYLQRTIDQLGRVIAAYSAPRG